MEGLGADIYIYILGNWAAEADGVCPGLWKHNLHPEFRQTVKLSLAACLAAGRWPCWWNAKGQWRLVEKEGGFELKRRIFLNV